MKNRITSTVEAERRSAPRYATNPDSVCRVSAPDDGDFQNAYMHNISTTGIKLIVTRAYDAGTALVVDLNRKDGVLHRTLMVRVTRVIPQPDGNFALGCAFLTPLDGHELLTLVL